MKKRNLPNNYSNESRDSPESNANLLSKLSFSWVIPYMNKARKGKIGFNDLYMLPTSFNPIDLGKRLLTSLSRSFYIACYAILDYYTVSLILTLTTLGIIYWSNEIETEFAEMQADYAKGESVSRLFYAYPVVLFLLNLAVEIILGVAFLLLFHAALKLKVGLMSSVFRKAISLSTSKLRAFGFGKLVNLIAVDSERIEVAAIACSSLIVTPVHFTIILLPLIKIAGLSTLATCLVLVLYLGIQYYINNVINKAQTEYSKIADVRVSLTEELLSGIYFFKSSALEAKFLNRIHSIRSFEQKQINKILICSCFSVLLNSVISLICAVSTICMSAIANLTLKDSSINLVFSFCSQLADRVFVYIPECVYRLGVGKNSAQRFSEFLNQEEEKETLAENTDEEVKINRDFAIKLENACFSNTRSDKEMQLTSSLNALLNIEDIFYNPSPICGSLINLDIVKGSLVAITGSVGSGKSSLVQALAGHFNLTSGGVKYFGSVGVCSQKPWITSGTIRENIILDGKFIKSKYYQVLDQCALLEDLDSFEYGDQTLLNSGGSNLSGGQKQRISLARFIYSAPDIVIVDDPFSALDSKTSLHVLSRCFLSGSLLDKTRIVVTQKANLLQYFDAIIEIDNAGEIAYKVNNNKNVAVVPCEPNTVELIERASQKSSLILDTTNNKKKSQGKESTTSVEEALFNRFCRYLKLASGFKTIFFFFILFLLQVFLDILSRKSSSIFGNPTALSFIGVQFISSPSLRILIGCLITLAYVVSVSMMFFLILFRYSKSASELHKLALNSTTYAKYYYFMSNSVGCILSKFSREMAIVDIELLEASVRLIRFLAGIGATLFLIGYISIGLGVLEIFLMFLLLSMPLVLSYLLFKFYKESWKQARELISKANQEIVGNFACLLEGFEVVKVLKQEQFFLKKNYFFLNDLLKSSNFLNNVRRWMTIYYANMAGLTACIARYVGIIINLNPLNFGMFVQYIEKTSAFMELFAKRISDLEAALVSFDLMESLKKVELEKAEDEKLASISIKKGIVEFKSINLAYGSAEKSILKNISLRIEAGEKVAVVGRSGAGKSSLINSILRLVEASGGDILIDNQNVKDFSVKSLRKEISFLTQDPVLFTGSIRFNLDPENVFSDALIYQALDLVNMKASVSKLPNKIDTVIVEQGSNLFSYGGRQLLCLARALLKNSKLIIMDEASSNLDSKTDEIIQTVIKNLSKQTVISVAHNLENVLNAYDRVIVMKNGEVIENEKPRILSTNPNSEFSNMLRASGLGPKE